MRRRDDPSVGDDGAAALVPRSGVVPERRHPGEVAQGAYLHAVHHTRRAERRAAAAGGRPERATGRLGKGRRVGVGDGRGALEGEGRGRDGACSALRSLHILVLLHLVTL